MFGLKRIYDWIGTKVHSSYAIYLLAFLFFIESSIFIIPVDPILMLFCIENRIKSFYYASIATLASVLGGAFGYFIGFAVWQSIGQQIVTLLFSPELFERVLLQYKVHEGFAILIAGFTPIPYKLATISAGFCKLPFIPFLGYSLLARGARFFLISTILFLYGTHIKEYIDRYFDILVCLFSILVCATLWLII